MIGQKIARGGMAASPAVGGTRMEWISK